MAENKTVANNESVDTFINSLADREQQEDSWRLVKIFEEITQRSPVMWGNAIIGFGSVSLTYASGRKVDWLEVGFSPRKGKISLYVTFDARELTSRFPTLGKYTVGKGCIYINKLADVDEHILRKLIELAYKTGYEQPKRTDGKEQIVEKS